MPNQEEPVMSEILQFREKTRSAVVAASHDGSLLAALDALDSEDEAEDEENDLQEGDAIIERSTSRRGTFLKRTKTELLMLMEDGSQEWKSPKSVKKVPKLNLASAIAIQQKDLELGLSAPADCALHGDEVINRKDGMVGRILERTTTDCLVERRDGTQTWNDVEDLVQALNPAENVREGEMVVSARRGRRSTMKLKKEGEMLILHDDGTEEWLSLAEVGVPKAVRAPPPPSLKPFKSYYTKNFKGSSFLEGFARSFAPPVQSEAPPPPPVQKKKVSRASQALKNGLKSGEVGKIVDNMEADEQLSPLPQSRSVSPKAQELFRRIDSDKDGVVSEDEFKEAYVKGVVTKAASFKLSPPPARGPNSSRSSGANSQGSDAFAALEEKIRQRNERLMNENARSVTSGKAPKSNSTRKAKTITSSSSAPTLGQADKSAELEEKVQQRNDRFMRENEALLKENRRLKALADSKKTADKIAGENDQLRKELDGKRNETS
jgi:hypothetical protein